MGYNMGYNMPLVGVIEKDKIELTCSNVDCGHKWMYRGKSKFYASCPFCRTNVHVFKNKLENLSLGNRSKSSPDCGDSNIHDSSGGEST
jgi:hypothetical protein